MFFPDAPRVESLFGLFVASALLGVLALIGAAHARAVGRTDWAGRMPVVWLEGLDTRSRSGRVWQALFLTAFVLFPVASLVKFFMRFAKARVIDHDTPGATFSPFCLWSCPLGDGKRFVVGDGLTAGNLAAKTAAGHVVDFCPVLEPLAIWALLACAGVAVAVFLVRVFRFALR